MSREIKFRGYSPISKIMYYFDLNFYKPTHKFKGEPEPIIMQYTGLKDLLDKEIYIGDIVRLSLLKGDYLSEVAICRLRMIPVVYFKGVSEFTSEPLHGYAGTSKDDTSVQVIGNIYQNPELLP